MTRARRLLALLLAAALAGGAGCRGGGLDSADPERRAAAVRAVAARGRDADLPLLLVAARDGSPAVRRAAAAAFAARGGPSAADALGKLLADPDAGVVALAAGGLAAMPGLPRAKEALLAAYADASPPGRGAIAEALQSHGTSLREAVELEARILWDRNVTALASGTPQERAGAAEELGASGRNEAVTRLLPLVDPRRNPDHALAAAAARGLGEAGDWGARPHLEALLADGDAALAEAAAGALGRLGDPTAADALAAAGADASGRIAGAAEQALAALPQAPEVGLALCELAVRTMDPAVAARAAAQARLREAECPERPLLARLGKPGAEAALAALGELGLQGAAADSAAQRIVPLLDKGPDPLVRVAAARALGRLRTAVPVSALQQRAGTLASRLGAARSRWIPGRLPATSAAGFGGDPRARLAAVLARAGPLEAAPGVPPGVPFVGGASGSEAIELGAVAAAIGHQRAPGAESLLLGLAHDPAPEIRAGAVEGLALLGDDPALAAVAEALGDEADPVRDAAAEGLAGLGPRGVPALARAVERSAGVGASWRVTLARALGEGGGEDAVPALTSLLDGPSGPAAAAALGKIGAPAAVGPLVAWLGNPSATGRVEAIEALAQLAARESAPAITAQLTSDRPEIRGAAARALGRLRWEAASGRLEALRSDYCGRVRRAAVEALAKLPTGAPRPHP